MRPDADDGIVTTQWGREVDVADPPAEPDPTLDIDGALAELDRTGCEAAVLASPAVARQDAGAGPPRR